MSNSRSRRQRKRRNTGLHPHEEAFLRGVHVPGCTGMGALALRHRPGNEAELKRRLEMIDRYAALIPTERHAIVERWVQYWKRELISPGEVGDPFLFNREPDR